MTARFEDLGSGRFRVSGELDFESVPGLWEASRSALDAVPEASIEFAGVTRVDSAGLALVVEWLRWSAAGGRRLSFANVPEKLVALARISELESLLSAPSRPAR